MDDLHEAIAEALNGANNWYDAEVQEDGTVLATYNGEYVEVKAVRF